MRTFTSLLLLPLLLLAVGCSGDDDVVTPPEPIPAGAMSYTGYDENGVAAIEGWILLDLAIALYDPAVPVSVTGTWELRRVNLSGDLGPQIGEGTLEAVLNGDRLVVNFNPNRTDDNVFADGPFTVIGGPASGMRWEGTWRWVTLSGTRRSGSFAAKG